MYPASGAVPRPEINQVVIEAAGRSEFFIGSKIMPPFGVDSSSGEYLKITKAGGKTMNTGGKPRGSGAPYPRMGMQYTADNYLTLDRGLESPIDDKDARAVANYFDMETITAMTVLENVMTAHEIRVAAAIFNTTNFGSATNSTVAYTTANDATANFRLDFAIARSKLRKRGVRANTVVMSQNVLDRLQGQVLFQNWLRGSFPTDGLIIVTPELVQSALARYGITQVLIGEAAYNAANDGQAFVAGDIWSDTYIWVGNVQGGELKAGGAGRTLVWNKEGGLWVSETYREENIRSNIVRVRQNTAEKIIDGEAGTLIATQYS